MSAAQVYQHEVSQKNILSWTLKVKR